MGHNWFPMIVATDERKWTWMDEGLNTFLQYYGERDYAKTYCGEQWTQTADCEYPPRRSAGRRRTSWTTCGTPTRSPS